MTPPRDKQYQNGLVIYPDHPGEFDRAVCIAARMKLQDIMVELRTQERLSKSELARVLQCPRMRVSRLLEQLNLTDFYAQQVWVMNDNQKLLSRVLCKADLRQK